MSALSITQAKLISVGAEYTTIINIQVHIMVLNQNNINATEAINESILQNTLKDYSGAF